MAPTGKIEKIENALTNAVSSYKWTISKFCAISINHPGESVYSPDFPIIRNGETLLCHIQLYPKGDTARYKDYLISKFIHHRHSQDPLNVDITQMSILNSKGNVIHQQKLRCATFTKDKRPTFLLIDAKSLLKSKNEVLVNGALVIQLDVIFDQRTFFQTPGTLIPVHNLIEGDKSRINDDFEKLLDNQKFSDVKFTVENKTIYSHKVMLTSRSQVFEAMFQHQMKESKDGIVNVTDVKYEVMKELLRFVYANKVNGIEKIARDLLIAADKYSIDDLKVLCEKSLFGSLDNGNAIQYLILTNSCSTFQLKSQVVQFIIDNPDVIEKPEFKTLDSDIIYEVLRTVTRKRIKH